MDKLTSMVAGLLADQEAECAQWRDWAMEDGWLAPEGAG